MSGVEPNFAGRRCGAAERFLPKPFSSGAFLRNVADLTAERGALPA